MSTRDYTFDPKDGTVAEHVSRIKQELSAGETAYLATASGGLVIAADDVDSEDLQDLVAAPEVTAELAGSRTERVMLALFRGFVFDPDLGDLWANVAHCSRLLSPDQFGLMAVPGGGAVVLSGMDERDFLVVEPEMLGSVKLMETVRRWSEELLARSGH